MKNSEDKIVIDLSKYAPIITDENISYNIYNEIMEKDPYNNIIVIGNNDIIYPCIIGGYDVDSYLLYVKEVNPKQFLACFPIEELVQDL